MTKNNLLLVLFAIVANSILAQTSVFKVTGNGNTIYIGGTIHLLQKNDFPLPEAFDQAYNASDILAFETDIAAIQDPKLAQEMMKKGMYSKDKSLETELSAETFESLKVVCEENGLPIALVNKMKPSMLIMTLSMMKLQKIGFTEEGIDQFYHNNALADKKELQFFETVDEQLNLLLNMGEDNEDEYVAYSLRDLEDMESTMEDLKQAWKIGDGEEMATQNTEMKKDYPATYKSLLLKRNNKWMKNLLKMIKTPETEFVLVGALHLYGPDGLLTLLKNKDYQVEQL